MRIVCQNTFIVFINGYLVLNERGKTEVTTDLCIHNLAKNYYFYEAEKSLMTRKHYDLLCKMNGFVTESGLL